MNGNNLEFSEPFEFDWITDDIISDYRFIVRLKEPENKDENYLELLSKVVRFHSDYCVIAEKWQVGELFTKEACDYYNEDLLSDYLNCLENYFLDNSISFFPNIFGGLKGGLMLSSHVCYFKGGVQMNKSIYGIEGNGKQRLFYDLARLVSAGYVPEENVIKIGSEGEASLDERDQDWFEFFIAFQSKLFYPYISNNYSSEMVPIDNRFSAYQNAPRFNSFLRDLKDLIINIYDWDFEFSPNNNRTESSELLTSKGILLDSKIIYQEDVDKERELPPEL